MTLFLYDGKKCVYEDFLGNDVYILGLPALWCYQPAQRVGKLLKKKYLTARIDLKPALTAEQLDARLLREFTKKERTNSLKTWPVLYFPAKLLPVMLDLGGIAPGKRCMRSPEKNVLDLSKRRAFPFTVTGLRGFQEAIITKGGVQVKEVDRRRWSQKTKGLYFAGEVLDLDALTGGYNLQIAWSTAHAAAMAAAEAER